MNADELQRSLIAAARANPPSDEVPYGFEQRIMARLKSAPALALALDTWALWASALWRSAAMCVALVLLVSAWSFFTPPGNALATGNVSTPDLSQELDNTVLAAVDQEPAGDSLW